MATSGLDCPADATEEPIQDGRWDVETDQALHSLSERNLAKAALVGNNSVWCHSEVHSCGDAHTLVLLLHGSSVGWQVEWQWHVAWRHGGK